MVHSYLNSKKIDMMNNKYLLGVDGGNSKTDYLLFDLEGNFIDGLRAGSSSHEGAGMGFVGAYNEMNKQIKILLERNSINIAEVCGAFGLAGADLPNQKEALNNCIRQIGVENFVMDNDGFLGIKAASTTGYGVCSINGTGTVNVGINEMGERIQIGGVGYISSDEAGGAFLVRRTFQAIFDELFRFGKPTKLTSYVFDKFGIASKGEYLEKIIGEIHKKTFERRTIIQLLFQYANEGDEVSIAILEEAGRNMGLSIAGCIRELHFTNPVPVILAGSIWANAASYHMLDSFKSTLNLVDNELIYIVLKAAPASGAILWAYELATGCLPSEELRQKVLAQVEEYQITQNPTR